MRNLGLILIFSLVASAAFAAISKEDVELLYKQTQALAAENLACNSKDECEIVPTISKSCGGPSEFAAISKNNLRYLELINLVQYLKEHMKASPCFSLSPPQAVCRSHICKTNYGQIPLPPGVKPSAE